MDGNGVWRFPEGSGRQGRVERYCCNVICGAPTTSEVKGLRLDEMSPGAIYMYKIMKKNCIKSDLKETFLKLVANDRNDKWFLLTSKFCPWGMYIY